MRYRLFAIVLGAMMLALTACNGGGHALGATRSFVVEDTLPAVAHTTARVVLLLGQSNATGVAANAYLQQKAPEEYARAQNGYDVYVNYITENGANSSQNRFVRAGLGQGASVDHFGPELGLAEVLAQSATPTFIIKYSWGGSMLDSQWLDGKGGRGELYAAALAFGKVSLDYLRNKGYDPQIAAACWMQGESDAIDKKTAERYYQNTKRLVQYLREDFAAYADADIDFVDAGIAEIEAWVHPQMVNEAKRRFADEDPHNHYFDTQEMGLTTLGEPEGAPDVAHYDALSALALGKAFAAYIR